MYFITDQHKIYSDRIYTPETVVEVEELTKSCDSKDSCGPGPNVYLVDSSFGHSTRPGDDVT